LPPPLLPKDATPSTPVWVIPETGEWFLVYEDYLNRMSFYNVKKFVCETSGNSNFTFFEALKVEHNELFSMQSNFPEPVKEPILRHVSFSTVPRIDMLVDQVYTKFKDDFFPGDKVIVKYTGGYRAHGIIKEKVVFNSRIDSNGIIKSPFISYRIYLLVDQNEIDIEDPSLIYRERNRFTKSYVKTFLKMSLTRSNRLGAPWVIRDEIAKKYKISLDWPNDLRKFDYIDSNNNNNDNNNKSISILNDDNETEHDDSNIEEINNNNDNDNDNDNDNNNNNKQKQKLILSKNSDNDNNNLIKSFNQNENSIDYGMKSTRGFSHTIFENLKETPPSKEDLYKKWCEHWYQILKRTTAYFEDLKSQDKSRDKVIKLFEFSGIKITDKFDPNNTHFIVTQRPFSLKEKYSIDDPFYYVHIKRIKVWHYEKCQRFFKSIKISNRRIYQIAKQNAIQKGINLIDSLANENGMNQLTDNEDLNNNSNKNFVNIAPAPSSDSKQVKGKGKAKSSKSKDSNTEKSKVKKEGKNEKLNDNNVSKSQNKKDSTNNTKMKNITNNKNNANITASSSNDNNNNNNKVGDDDNNNNKENETSSEKKSHKPIIIDDLLLPIKQKVNKPNWKNLENHEKLPFDYENCPISMSNVLEFWIFINMFHEAFIIDTFTFDDFIYALQWKDLSKASPLLAEIFCALLSCIISKQGELLITLPIDIEAEIKESEKEKKKKKLMKERERERKNKLKESKIINGNEIEIDEESEDDQNNNDDVHDNKIKEDTNDADVEEEEEEEINHNAYSILDYKKVAWRERLQNRDFKNGNWLIILIGVFSMCEYIPEFKKEIVSIYELLSPIDEIPTPEKLLENFCHNVNAVKRVSILTILMNLLLNGNIIRLHTDYVVDKAASLRREKLEIQKEVKIKIENAHTANKDVLDALRLIDIKEIKQRIEDHELEMLKTNEEKEKFLEMKNKGGRPIQNILPTEPSALEKAVAAGHPDFLKLLNIRSEKINEIEDLKKQKLEIDKTLVELNCQRIRYLGRDKVWNRYWWFERNGLPNLGGNKDADEDDDDEKEEEDDEDEDDAFNEDEDNITVNNKNDSNSEYDSETYLMGRIWIQGPNNIDLQHLRSGDSSGYKRKMIEEGEKMLRNERDWVYIDTTEDFDKLVGSLNDKGIRERALKKELNDCKDLVISSFKARQKGLYGNEQHIKLSQYIKDLENGLCAKTKEEENIDGSKEKAEDSLKQEVSETIEIDDNDIQSDEDEIPRMTRSRRSLRQSKRPAEDNATGPNTRNKRRHIHLSDTERDTHDDSDYESKDEDEVLSDSDNVQEMTEEDVINEMIDQLQLPKITDPIKLRDQLIIGAKNRLKELEEAHREENMALWVNSTAIEKQSHSHYEGPRIVKSTRSGRGGRSGRGNASSKSGRGSKGRRSFK
jgi:hypothetical protein